MNAVRQAPFFGLDPALLPPFQQHDRGVVVAAAAAGGVVGSLEQSFQGLVEGQVDAGLDGIGIVRPGISSRMIRETASPFLIRTGSVETEAIPIFAFPITWIPRTSVWVVVVPSVFAYVMVR